MTAPNDYMLALQRRFQITSQRTVKLRQAADAAFAALQVELSRKQRKTLLRFLDAENSLLDESRLDSFFSGFRLEDGIHRELSAIPPYSYEQEDEERARELNESEEIET